MEQSVRKPPQRADGESAVEFVAQRLRDGILHGRYAPGQRLIEAEATADYAVSRHTLRAALGRLAAEGLVETTPNRGSIVRKLSRRELHDLFEIRAAFDALVAQLAAQRIGEGDNRARLQKALKVWTRQDVAVDAALHLECNAMFHGLLFEISGNVRIAEVVRQMQVPGYRVRFQLLLVADKLARSTADHLAIGKAVLAGDARKAAALARAHTQFAGALLQSLPDSDFSA